MAQSVSQRFLNASAADVNRPVSKVQLVLGNYCSAAAYGAVISSTGNDLATTNYPASGIIDGDRTELNVGPASGADNDVGGSSWRSSGIPAVGAGIVVIIDLKAVRTINRIKLYHRSGHGLKYFYFSSSLDNAIYPGIISTPGSSGGNQTLITNGQLDVIDFPDVTLRYLYIAIEGTQVPGDFANIVEIEAYRLIDISDRVKSVKVSRQRDYKLANPMAAQVQIDCLNDDRYFSISHVPTAAEVAAGFVNQELRPDIGIIVQQGFDYYGPAPELVTTFVGTVDGFTLKPKTRDAVIVARDAMKTLINNIDSSKLKAGQTIDANLRYVLNRQNISNYEMSLDVSPILIDYFFTDQQAPLDTCRDLTQAAVDSLFYFDEKGIATFRQYVGSSGSIPIPQDRLFTSQADFNLGSFAGDLQSVPDQLQLTPAGGGTGETLNGTGNSPGFLNIPANAGGIDQIGVRIIPSVNGTITQVALGLKIGSSLGSTHTVTVNMALYSESGGVPGSSLASTNFLQSMPPASPESTFNLPAIATSFPVTAGTPYWLVASVSPQSPPGVNYIKAMNIASGSWSGGGNAKGRYDVTPTAWQDVEDSLSVGAIGTSSGSYSFVGSSLSGTWTTPVIDCGASIQSFGQLIWTQVLNLGTIAWVTRSSPDGVSWSPYVALGGSNQINSPVARYLQAQLSMGLSSSSNPSPLVLDVTANWVDAGGGGASASLKYPAVPSSFTFSFDSMLLDVQQEIADNLGGDSAIINDATVQAQPLVLTGNDADTVWQGTIGTPPTNISGTAPLSVTAGTPVIINPFVSGGMDISRMSGANPAALVVVFGGGGAGSWAATSIHPTLPIFKITITGTGTITDLRITGKKFSNTNFIQAQRSTDQASIALYGDRQLSLSNSWIVSQAIALAISQAIVANSKDPVALIPSAQVRFSPSAQIGDRVTINDVNLDLTADYIIVGEDHPFSVQDKQADAHTDLVLLKVPVGS